MKLDWQNEKPAQGSGSTKSTVEVPEVPWKSRGSPGKNMEDAKEKKTQKKKGDLNRFHSFIIMA